MIRKSYPPLTVELLRELLSYDPATGIFTWKKHGGGPIQVGSVAGKPASRDGYVAIGIQNKRYLAHRLVWLYVHGRWPYHKIDHIDGNPANNSLANLREATQAQNVRNNCAKGVTERNGRYRARIAINKVQIELGVFDSPELARAAYLAATKKYFGEFSVVHSRAAQEYRNIAHEIQFPPPIPGGEG